MMNAFTGDIDQSINKGVNYLHQHQYPYGEFCSYMSGDDPMQGWMIPDSTIFTTALISTSLSYLKNSSKVDTMQALAGQFLENQVQRGGVWGFFTNWHRYYSVLPCDTDDTVCTSIALINQGKPQHSANKPVILANRNNKGLFYTWFVIRPVLSTSKTYWRIVLQEAINPVKSLVFWLRNECNRNDIDAVVNANVLYYLGNTKDTQPVIEYLIKIITENKEHDCDKWYHNPFTVYYFISRNYHAGITELEPARKPVVDRILATAHTNGQLGDTVLDTALSVCTLLNWNHRSAELDQAVSFLMASQNDSGNWPRQILFYGGPKKKVGWGSEELTTGFCLEALERYRQSLTTTHSG